MSLYSKTNIGNEARTELHDVLSFTGADVSINTLPAGAGVPFIHARRENEKIYGVISGRGKVTLNGETVSLQEGDWIRMAPEAKRQFSAADVSSITFICIQVKANSLSAYTANDAAYTEKRDNCPI